MRGNINYLAHNHVISRRHHHISIESGPLCETNFAHDGVAITPIMISNQAVPNEALRMLMVTIS